MFSATEALTGPIAAADAPGGSGNKWTAISDAEIAGFVNAGATTALVAAAADNAIAPKVYVDDSTPDGAVPFTEDLAGDPTSTKVNWTDIATKQFVEDESVTIFSTDATDYAADGIHENGFRLTSGSIWISNGELWRRTGANLQIDNVAQASAVRPQAEGTEFTDTTFDVDLATIGQETITVNADVRNVIMVTDVLSDSAAGTTTSTVVSVVYTAPTSTITLDNRTLGSGDSIFLRRGPRGWEELGIGGGGSSNTFNALQDTPDTYPQSDGQSLERNNYAVVNGANNGIEFTNPFPVNDNTNRLNVLNGLTIRSIGADYIEFATFTPNFAAQSYTLNFDQPAFAFAQSTDNPNDFLTQYINHTTMLTHESESMNFVDGAQGDAREDPYNSSFSIPNRFEDVASLTVSATANGGNIIEIDGNHEAVFAANEVLAEREINGTEVTIASVVHVTADDRTRITFVAGDEFAGGIGAGIFRETEIPVVIAGDAATWGVGANSHSTDTTPGQVIQWTVGDNLGNTYNPTDDGGLQSTIGWRAGVLNIGVNSRSQRVDQALNSLTSTMSFTGVTNPANVVDRMIGYEVGSVSASIPTAGTSNTFTLDDHIIFHNTNVRATAAATFTRPFAVDGGTGTGTNPATIEFTAASYPVPTGSNNYSLTVAWNRTVASIGTDTGFNVLIAGDSDTFSVSGDVTGEDAFAADEELSRYPSGIEAVTIVGTTFDGTNTIVTFTGANNFADGDDLYTPGDGETVIAGGGSVSTTPSTAQTPAQFVTTFSALFDSASTTSAGDNATFADVLKVSSSGSTISVEFEDGIEGFDDLVISITPTNNEFTSSNVTLVQLLDDVRRQTSAALSRTSGNGGRSISYPYWFINGGASTGENADGSLNEGFAVGLLGALGNGGYATTQSGVSSNINAWKNGNITFQSTGTSYEGFLIVPTTGTGWTLPESQNSPATPQLTGTITIGHATATVTYNVYRFQVQANNNLVLAVN